MKNQFNFIKSISILFFCILPYIVFAQDIKITGKVVDLETGDPLPSVTIIVEGTTTGTNTDFDGMYTINVSGPDAKLIFKYLGYLDRTVVVGNQRTINVSLKQAVTDLDEIVVIGYGTAKKTDIAGSTATVKGSAI